MTLVTTSKKVLLQEASGDQWYTASQKGKRQECLVLGTGCDVQHAATVVLYEDVSDLDHLQKLLPQQKRQL